MIRQDMETHASSDSELLSAWIEHRRESAFHALVARYATLVHMAAKRTSGDESIAADASQLVFILLAQKARSLTSHPTLAGWLHITAVLKTRDLVDRARRESRKRSHLQAAMETAPSPTPQDTWREIQLVLDEALAALSDKDRDILLLRFYRSLTVREVAATLGIATDAAQKRIDRATERLRGKLARRGVQTSGTLSAAMLTGFAADAQAVLPISVLASKAIAAGAVSSGFLSWAVSLLAAMKSTSLIAPVGALVLAGLLVGGQRRTITTIQNENLIMEKELASVSALTGAMPRSTKVVAKMNSTNWEEIAAELAEAASSGGGRSRRASMIFQQRLNKMSKDEIVSAFEEVSALGLPPDSWSALKYSLLGTLIELDPEYVVTRFFHQLLDDPTGASTLLSHALGKWAAKDARNAAEWLDQQVASGALEGRQIDALGRMRLEFEGVLIGALITTDPAAAEVRLENLPAGQRQDATRYVGRIQDGDLLTYADLLRSHLDLEGSVRALSTQLSYFGSSYEYTKIDDFLDAIHSTPAERAAIASEIVQRKFQSLFSSRKISLVDLDEMRVWIGSQSPASIDTLTGHTLAQALDTNFPLNFEEAAALASHYQETSRNDDVLISFLQCIWNEKYASQAKILAGKISDITRRNELLGRFKSQ
ncbi:MAG: RNA polymerase sigma factor [Luteolibacter sp.]